MKLIINEKQSIMLRNHINETYNQRVVVSEGTRDIALGVLMLMGVKLSGMNAQLAKQALNDKETLKKIEQSLESPDIEELVQTIEMGGMKDAMNLIQSNAEKLIDNYNRISKKMGIDSKLIRIYNIN
jgi:hypothetical protein